MYSVGGSGYSERVDDWYRWFGTAKSARELASYVGNPYNWPCDGIDIDLEQGAGEDHTISENLIVFVQELRRLRPNFIIT